MSVQFINVVYSFWTVTAKTDSNSKSEHGHLDNLDTGQMCAREKTRTFSEPGVFRGLFLHDLFIWEDCGCLIFCVGLRRHRKTQEPCEVEVVCRGPHG